MAKYITLPNGASFPMMEGESPEQAVAAAMAKYPEAFGFEAPQAEQPQGGFTPALKAGFQRLVGQGALTAGKAGLIDTQRAEQIAQEREARAKQIFQPTEESFVDAPLQNVQELLGGSLPYAVAPLAIGAGAAALGAPAVVGAGAAGLASLAQFTGSNLERAMGAQGKPLADVSGGAAVAAAVPQAALDVVGFRFVPGIGKLFGAAGEKVTADTARQLASQTAGKILADYAAATGKTMTAEGLTEAMQQVLERAQAGLATTDPEARGEYLQSFFGGVLLGGVMALPGRAVERGQMKAQSQQLAAEQQRQQREQAAAAAAAQAQGEAQAEQAATAAREQQALDAERGTPAQTQPFYESPQGTLAGIEPAPSPAGTQGVLAAERERRAYGPESQQALYEGLFEQAGEAGVPQEPAGETPDALRARLMRDQRGLQDQRDQLRTQAQGATTAQELQQLAQRDRQLANYQQQVESQLKAAPAPAAAVNIPALDKQLKRLTKAVATAKDSGDIGAAARAQTQLEQLRQQQVQTPVPAGDFRQAGGQSETQAAFNQRVIGPEIGAAREARLAAQAQREGALAPELQALERIAQRADIAPYVAQVRGELQGRREVEGMERAAAMNRIATEQGELFQTPQTPAPTTRTVTPPRVTPDALQRLIARAKNSAFLPPDDRQLLGSVEANFPAMAASPDKARLDTVADWLYRAATGNQSPERRAEVSGLLRTLEQGRLSETEATKEAQYKALTKDERRAMQGLTPGTVPGPQLRTSGRRGLMERAPTGPQQRAVQQDLQGMEPTATAFANFREFENYLASTGLAQLRDAIGLKGDTLTRQLRAIEGMDRRVQELRAQIADVVRKQAAERAAAAADSAAAAQMASDSQARLYELQKTLDAQLGKEQIRYLDSARKLAESQQVVADLAQEVSDNVAQLEQQIQDFEMRTGQRDAAIDRLRGVKQELKTLVDAQVADKQTMATSLQNIAGGLPFYANNVAFGEARMRTINRQQQLIGVHQRLLQASSAVPAMPKLSSTVFRDFLITEAQLQAELSAAQARMGGFVSARNRAKKALDDAFAAQQADPAIVEALSAARSDVEVAAQLAGTTAEKLQATLRPLDAELQALGALAEPLVRRLEQMKAAAQKTPGRRLQLEQTRLEQAAEQRREGRLVAAQEQRAQQAEVLGGATQADRTAVTFARPAEGTLDSRQFNDLLATATDTALPVDERRRATDALADMVVGIDRAANEFARNTQIEIDKHLARLEKLQDLRTNKPGQVANIAETEARIARGLERLRKRAGATKTRVLTTQERQAEAQQTLRETQGAPLDAAEQEALAQYPRGRSLGPAARNITAAPTQLRTGSPESIAGENRPGSKNPIREARGEPQRDTALSAREMQIANAEAARLKGLTPAARAAQVAEAEAVAKEMQKQQRTAPVRRSRVAEAIEDIDMDETFDAGFEDLGGVLREDQNFYTNRERTEVSEEAAEAAFDGRTLDLLAELASTGSTDHVRSLSAALRPLLMRTKIVVADGPIVYQGAVAEGMYSPSTNTVTLSSMHLTEEAILHELTHAATMRALEGDVTLTPSQQQAVDDLRGLLARVRENPAIVAKHGLGGTDAAGLREFVSELQASRELRDAIDALPQGLLRRIFNAILRLVGARVPTQSARAVEQAYELFAPSRSFAFRPDGVKAVLRGVFPATAAEFNADIPQRVRDMTARTVGRDLTLVDKLQAHIAGFRTAYIDRFDSIDRALRQGVDRGLIPQLQAFQTQYFLRFGEHRNQFVEQAASNGVPQLIKHADGTFTIETPAGEHANLAKIATLLHGANVGNEQATEQLFTQYLAVLRAEQDGVGYEKLNFGAPLTAADAAEIKRTITADPARKQAFEAARAVYREYNHKLLDFLQQTDALSKDEVARLKSKEYVPYYRNRGGVVELVVGSERPVRIGNIVDQPYLKELVGDDAKILPFFTGALQNTSLLIDMALRNQQTKDVAMTLHRMGVSTIGSGDGPTDVRDIVRFKIDGEPKFARVENSIEEFGVNAELLVQGMSGIKTTLPAFLTALQIPANWLRKAVTRAPAYAVRQIIREPINAWLTSGGNFTPVVSSVKELASMVRGTSEKELQLQRAGAISSNVITGDIQDQVRILRDISSGKTTFDKVMSVADKFAMQGDAATRAVLYDTYRKQGMTHMQALLGSLESMNFARRGVSPSMQMMSQLVPFFNAQVQGMDVIYRALRGQAPLERQLDVRRKLLKRGLMVSAAAMAYAAAMQDDEAYKNATPEQRALNWFLPLPGLDEPLRVPIPFELGYLFKVLPETVVNVAAGDQDAGDAVKLYAGLLQQTVPFGVPQAVKPAIEVLTNHSFFTGEAVETGRERSMQKSERARESTTELAKMLGGTGLLSPIQIDYLIRGYTGGLGIAVASIPNFALRPLNSQDSPELPEKTLSQLPLLGPLFQPRDGRAAINAAYDEIEGWQQAHNTFQNLLASGRRADAAKFAQDYSRDIALNSVGGAFKQQMGELAKLRRAVTAGPGTPESKRQQIDAIKQVEIRLARKIAELGEKA